MQVDVILLERVAKLGQIGDIVRVKSGYARNFLIPSKKALRATEANKAEFENRKSQIEAQNLETRSEAEKLVDRVQGQQITLIRQASENGQLYGSVSSKDIAKQMHACGLNIDHKQVFIADRYKMLGIFEVTVNLHAEVQTHIMLNIAKSQDEAEQQWTRYQNGEPVLMTAAEEEAIEERKHAEALMRREQEKAEKAAAAAEAQAADEAKAEAEQQA